MGDLSGNLTKVSWLWFFVGGGYADMGLYLQHGEAKVNFGFIGMIFYRIDNGYVVQWLIHFLIR